MAFSSILDFLDAGVLTGEPDRFGVSFFPVNAIVGV